MQKMSNHFSMQPWLQACQHVDKLLVQQLSSHTRHSCQQMAAPGHPAGEKHAHVSSEEHAVPGCLVKAHKVQSRKLQAVVGMLA